MEGKKCFPFTSLLGGEGGDGGVGDRNDSSRSGSLTVEVETTHESNSAFSTVCSNTQSHSPCTGERWSALFSKCPSWCRRPGTRSRVHRKRACTLNREKSRVYASIVRDVLDLTNFRRITIDRKGLDNKTTKNGLGKIGYVDFFLRTGQYLFMKCKNRCKDSSRKH